MAIDIYLSVNNRAQVLRIPVIPPEFTISKPQTAEKFETVNGDELSLIGKAGLKSITLESFFPVRDYPYLRDRSMWGWEYVYMIDTWIEQKLPIRLIITTSSAINIVCRVEDFEYTIKSDGDLWYSLTLEQMQLLGQENYETAGKALAVLEEELDMADITDLESRVTYLEGVVQTLSNPMIYDWIDENMPEWAHEPVRSALNSGALSGTPLGLTYEQLRMITVMYRAGVFS